jgi:hypothetical protein
VRQEIISGVIYQFFRPKNAPVLLENKITRVLDFVPVFTDENLP